MRRGTIALLILSSLLNAAICAGSFLFALFATNPGMQDVTMRIGYYVLNLISLTALAGTIAPWIFASRKHNRSALVFAIIPTVLTCLAIVSFLTLDSWLRRTFADQGAVPDPAITAVALRSGVENSSEAKQMPHQADTGMITGTVQTVDGSAL